MSKTFLTIFQNKMLTIFENKLMMSQLFYFLPKSEGLKKLTKKL